MLLSLTLYSLYLLSLRPQRTTPKLGYFAHSPLLGWGLDVRPDPALVSMSRSHPHDRQSSCFRRTSRYHGHKKPVYGANFGHSLSLPQAEKTEGGIDLLGRT